MFEHASVTVVIPALNEEQAIAMVLGAMPSWVDEVIVVDNGCTDQTAAVARRHGARVVRQPLRGYGAACLAGIAAAAQADILVFLDADFRDDPKQMERLVAPIERGAADMVIGSRTRGCRERGALTLPQRWGNTMACLLIRALWGHEYTDLGPFRAVRATALSCLHMDDRTYGWTIQMQIRALRAGLRVLEVPVDYRRRIGRSKISGTVRGVIGAGAKILSTVVRERLHAPPISTFPVRPEHLIVFTRFPDPGTTKTRLIPALGADGAADLQRAMTVQTLQTTQRLRFTRHVSAEVRFAGGDESRMAALFGDQHTYLPQPGGDLGARMHHALTDAFARGSQRAVVIGTDCPELDAGVLNAAFDGLQTHDCVIGPARDGGYYLIGLTYACRQIFEGITWGSARVLEQTKRQAASAGLKVHTLSLLFDVDEPHDMPVWERNRRPQISVIIPAINEAPTIAVSIKSALVGDEIEVLVVDGGSNDDTPQIARDAGAGVIDSAPGRANQMNTGAAAARGSILLFLHADTVLPIGYQRFVYETLARPDVSAGAFRLRIAAPGPLFRGIEGCVQFRSKFLQFPYGDQAIFLKAETFYPGGGFPDWPMMEDFELVRSVRRIGRIEIAPASVMTSPRRWQANGVLRTAIVNQVCIVARILGVPADRMATWRGRRGKHHSATAPSHNGCRIEPGRAATASLDEPAIENIA